MQVLMPKLGETVAEGTILAWRKRPGDAVAVGEVLFEVETDKVSMDVEATGSGVLRDILVADGETAAVGAVVAEIGPAAGAETSPPAPSEHKAAPPPPARAAPPPGPAASRARDPRLLGLNVSPLARRLALEAAIDLGEIAPTVVERGGRRLSAADVREAVERRGARPEPATPAVPVPEDRPYEAAPEFGEPLSRIRLAAARRLASAWREAPHVFQAQEVDFTAVARCREAVRSRSGRKLTYLPFVARAVCRALAEFPRLNALGHGERLDVRREINLGIAVDLDHEGLVVPVVRGAERMNVLGLSEAIRELVERARAGRLKAQDLEGGTYTISNNGSFGALFTAPIINVPQVAILSLDAISRRPAVVQDADGGEALAIRTLGHVAQSFDHRFIDGAYSAAFLGRVRRVLQTTDWEMEIG